MDCTHTGWLVFCCGNRVSCLHSWLVEHDPLVWFWPVICGQQLCPILPHLVLPNSAPLYQVLSKIYITDHVSCEGQEGECQFELEGCLEELWLTWA